MTPNLSPTVISLAFSALLAILTTAVTTDRDPVTNRTEPVFESSTTRARAILAEVSIAGEVVLRGRTSDDGHPDADAVWDRLKTLPLLPTDAFAKLDVQDDADRVELHGTPTGEEDRNGRILRNHDLGLRISYGGSTETFRLVIRRTTGQNGEKAWAIDPEIVESYFSLRQISRREARLLDDPGRER